jgi:uncharacterized protein YcbK (DUF882 family)
MPSLAALLPLLASLLSTPLAVLDVTARHTSDAGVRPADAAATIEVEMRSETTRETLAVALPLDGVVDPATAATLEHFFRDGATGRARPIAAGTLGLLAQIAARYPGQRLEILSATRPKGRGARGSKHTTGHAIDLRVSGVPASEVRDFVWSLQGEIGLGHCRARNFVHIDHRSGEPKIGWDESSNGRPVRYGPRWTRPRGDRPNT